MRTATCLIGLGLSAAASNLAAQQPAIATVVTQPVTTTGTPPAAISVPRLTPGDGSSASARPTTATTGTGATGTGGVTGTLTPDPEAPNGPQVTTPTVTTPTVTTPVRPVDVTVIPAGRTGAVRLINLSTRARVAPETPLVTGFSIRGTTTLTVLVRVAGPALRGFGVSDAVAAPRLRLRDGSGNLISENAGWTNVADGAAAIAGAFAFTAGGADAAVVATLAPGSYSAEVTADGGQGGVALVEVYDVFNQATGSRLSNVSTLGTVTSGTSDVVSGFVIGGTGTAQYLIRGVGPSLTKLGVGGTLVDPKLTVFNSSGGLIATNDDWSGYAKPGVVGVPVAVAVAGTATGGATGTTPSGTVIASTPTQLDTASRATGAFALDARGLDAGLVTTLGPGAYTVQMSGVGTFVISTTPTGTIPAGTTDSTAGVAQPVQAVAVSMTTVPPAPGVALLEIYEVP